MLVGETHHTQLTLDPAAVVNKVTDRGSTAYFPAGNLLVNILKHLQSC